MKEYRKTATVQAKLFEPGDEDGYNDIITSGTYNGKSVIEKRPYVYANEAVYGSFFDEYLCISENGDKFFIKKYIFESTYEEVVKNRR